MRLVSKTEFLTTWLFLSDSENVTTHYIFITQANKGFFMTEWTIAVWGALGAAFIVGIFIGVLVTRMASRNVQKHLQLQADLKTMQHKVDEQKLQLESHFAESAELLATLATDYKKLYDHLANSSTELLPEEHQAEFFKLTTKEDQPRDYSESSSGLFKKQ